MKKILIVDDDPVSLYLLANFLSELNYSYVTAEDGLQALLLLEHAPHEFSLLITDRIMPKLHGLELLAKMRQHPILKELPVIMLTGVAEKEEIVEAIKAGINDFLYKPIAKDLLQVVLKRFCRVD
jgi:CheY-like chemotaxis protein